MIKSIDINKLNNDIKKFEQVFPITKEMRTTHEGISRMVMLDRYSFKDQEKETLNRGDLVLLTIKPDPDYPARGVGIVQSIDWDANEVDIWIEEEYQGLLSEAEEQTTGVVTRSIDTIDKPLELYYEQIAKRNAYGLSEIESIENRQSVNDKFYKILSNMDFIPAGRILYGAGSKTDVTYFNCYVMPFIPDSREGIAMHRQEVMEIMSRGGGVGSNGSTLRPRNALARGVNGRSSGSVSWLEDIAQLTHLVEQGGSRRGAQMIMLADWHPDILEFIISKVQNPSVLRHLIEQSTDEKIIQLAQQKLKLTPLSPQQQSMYESIVQHSQTPGAGGFSSEVIAEAKLRLRDGGVYTVHHPEYLSGANISVTLTDDFMRAVKNNDNWTLKFPDIENYTPEEMDHYNEEWSEIGDIRDWEKFGGQVKDYHTLPAKELWNLINVCATYSAEPGIFFIDNANEATNAQAYGQKVVATNPCGEQPLAPYSVCNLAAVNLANMVNKETQVINYNHLIDTVQTAVRMQDNVIDVTPYFLESNKKQALGERRIGLGVMGLADLLIYSGHIYGSRKGNQIIDKIFKTMAVTAYETSIELAKERGSFPFLVGETEEETQQLRQKFIETGYMRKMPKRVRQGILKHGIRNSHLLTVAPTGSTGTMMGVSTGLEPYFAYSYFRSGRLGEFIEVNADIVQEYLDRHPETDENNLPKQFISSMELSPEAHVDVQTTIQKWVDSSISKTVNAPRGYTVDQVKKIYERLYEGGAKGGTVYVDGSRDSQVLSLIADEDDATDIQESPVKASLKINTLVTHTQSAQSADDNYGSEIGDACPLCRQGTIQEIGGCNTCDHCNVQMACGL